MSSKSKIEAEKDKRASLPTVQSEQTPAASNGCGNGENRPADLIATPGHPMLPGFRGDTSWIHQREGHVGRPYWPDGLSGITLDPGIDLGHVEPRLVKAAFGERLSKRQLNAVQKAMGIQGAEARAVLRQNATLRSIRISRSTAALVFPYLLRPYWRSLRDRFPTIAEPNIPAEVQTVLLSLAYNRGTWNPELTRLHRPLETRRWNHFAEVIRGMQQDHLLEGIRRRRRIESLLISSNLLDGSRSQTCSSSRWTRESSQKDPQDPQS